MSHELIMNVNVGERRKRANFLLLNGKHVLGNGHVILMIRREFSYVCKKS